VEPGPEQSAPFELLRLTIARTTDGRLP